MEIYKWKNRNKKYKSTKLIRIIRDKKMVKRIMKKSKIIWLKTRWKWDDFEVTEDKGVIIPIKEEELL